MIVVNMRTIFNQEQGLQGEFVPQGLARSCMGGIDARLARFSLLAFVDPCFAKGPTFARLQPPPISQR